MMFTVLILDQRRPWSIRSGCETKESQSEAGAMKVVIRCGGWDLNRLWSENCEPPGRFGRINFVY